MRPILLLAVLVLALPARASGAGPDTVPETVATIAPVHSLVAQVMQGAGAPHLLIPPGASPHDYAMRPSDAAALEGAEVVFWVGSGIEGWLEGPLGTLASDARIVRLDAVPGLTRLPVRTGSAFEAHGEGDGHGHDGHGHAGGAHDGHDAPAHDDPAHDGHAHDADQGDDTDPHLWLDPENGKAWAAAIAAALAEADPANAALYARNAEAARTEIEALEAEIAAMLAPLRGRPFVVFHDAYHYFERRFDIEAAAAVTLSDARSPGPARIAAIREVIRETGAQCVFREPQFRPALVETVAEGTGAEGTGARIGVLDPVGATLEPGPGLYAALLRGLAAGLADCLG